MPCPFIRRVWLLGLLTAAALSVSGTRAAPAAPLPAPSFWRDGQPVSGWDFGTRSPQKDGRVFAQPVWLLSNGPDARGERRTVPGQASIFDVKPGDSAYTDLWQLVLVTVPETYQANSARSAADLVSAGYPQTVTTIYLNCPFANEGDSLAGSAQPPLQGWVRGQPVSYFDFGQTTPEVGTIWELTHTTVGDPVPIAEQLPIIDGSAASFRRLVWVQVPDGFVPNTITTAEQVQASGFELVPTDRLVNVAGLPPIGPQLRGMVVWVLLALFAAGFLAAMLYIVIRPI